jgi:hypothetical protein
LTNNQRQKPARSDAGPNAANTSRIHLR